MPLKKTNKIHVWTNFKKIKNIANYTLEMENPPVFDVNKWTNETSLGLSSLLKIFHKMNIILTEWSSTSLLFTLNLHTQKSWTYWFSRLGSILLKCQ